MMLCLECYMLRYTVCFFGGKGHCFMLERTDEREEKGRTSVNEET